MVLLQKKRQGSVPLTVGRRDWKWQIWRRVGIIKASPMSVIAAEGLYSHVIEGMDTIVRSIILSYHKLRSGARESHAKVFISFSGAAGDFIRSAGFMAARCS